MYGICDGNGLWFDTPPIDGEHVEVLKRGENGPTGEMRFRGELRRQQAWVRRRGTCGLQTESSGRTKK